MINRLAHAAVLVGDYDEAIQWYTESLGLELRADTVYGQDYRWLTVGVPGQDGIDLVLHRACTDGTQILPPFGKQPAFVLFTDDCFKETEILRQRGVRVTRDPSMVLWGIESILEDPYGNLFALVQPCGIPPRNVARTTSPHGETLKLLRRNL